MKHKGDKRIAHRVNPHCTNEHLTPVNNFIILPRHLARIARRAYLKMRQPAQLEPLNVYTERNGKKLQYVWDGLNLRLMPADRMESRTRRGRLCGNATQFLAQLKIAFFPSVDSVTGDYWEFMKWGHCERFWASSMKLLGTQSMLMALGIGAKKSLSASAALNWMLRDGLGKVTRTVVATKFGDSFDSNLKRSRCHAALYFTAAVGLELLCPSFPQHFLLLASLANVAHAIALTVYTSTSPVLTTNFSKESSIGVFTAKQQARRMVVDSAALGMIASFMHIFRDSPRALSLTAYPVCTVMMMVSTYNQLRALELRTLNSERLEILSRKWVRDREVLPPSRVSQLEGLWGGASKSQKSDIPTSFGVLEDVASSPTEILDLMQAHKEDKYLVAVKDSIKPRIMVSLRQDALPSDVLSAFLHVAHAKYTLQSNHCAYNVRDTRTFVQHNINTFVTDLKKTGWATEKYWFSTEERHGYVY